MNTATVSTTTTEATATRTLFSVPESNIEALSAKLERLAKRARKLGLQPPTIATVGHKDIPLVVIPGANPFEWRRTEPIPADYRTVGYRRYLDVQLHGEAPTIPGWSLVAVVEHTNDSEIGNVIRGVPGMECPVAYRQATPLCQHCHMTRRRTETFVLVNDTGTYQQIGRNCLADFCRDAAAAANLASAAEILAGYYGLCCSAEGEDFEEGTGQRYEPRKDLEDVLATTARVIRHLGWVSRGTARERLDGTAATADLLTEVFFNPRFFERKDRESTEDRELREACQDIQAQDVELATAALAWIRDMRPQADTLGDYLYNLLVVCSDETVLRKHFGLACSLISAYQREQGKQIERQERERARAVSAHFGTVKARGRWQFTLTAVNHFESDWGCKHLYRFVSSEGNVAIWWASSEATDIRQGEQVWVVGTVKDHTEYKGLAQTVLSRCDVYPVADTRTCPHCAATVLRNDIGKPCPTCRKRGAKIPQSLWTPAEATTASEGTAATAVASPQA